MNIHPLSDVQSLNIGQGSRIWQFSVIFPHARIGKDCNICAHTLIENDVIVGDRVTIKSGSFLWDGITIENDVFIGPCVAFTNDKYPRSKKYPDRFLKTHIKKGASLGANATILPGLTLGQYCIVGAGAVVTKDIPDYAIVTGNPAQIVGWAKKED
ncbi:acyltransferase [Xenorhabdus bharatensis]|uniref:acyltransferase n=1 Tax=Xenorhabdus bharatensis TaxID=3136256 RepID=UPI0030F3D33C